MLVVQDIKGLLPLNNIVKEIIKGYFPEMNAIPERPTYQTCVGHALGSPLMDYTNLTTYIDIFERSEVPEIDATIMVVDDEQPEDWYQRLLAVGFKEIEGQQGYFFDCESALEALKTEHYDIILTDLELVEGRMQGIEFVERVYEAQQAKGVPPLISIFSHSQRKLSEAYKRVGSKIFDDSIMNNKLTFSSFSFMLHASWALERNSQE